MEVFFGWNLRNGKPKKDVRYYGMLSRECNR